MNHRPLTFIDIETTGGMAMNSRITEIGGLRVEDGKVIEKFSQLINPKMLIPEFITELTGITNEMVKDAPEFELIADKLEDFLDDSIFIAHHVVFDYGFIKAEFNRIKRKFNMDRICSAKLSRTLHPEHRYHGLDKIIDRIGIEVVNRHRGFDDAEVIWRMVQAELLIDELNVFRKMNRIMIHHRNTIY